MTSEDIHGDPLTGKLVSVGSKGKEGRYRE
jgi:hypothetical protein